MYKSSISLENLLITTPNYRTSSKCGRKKTIPKVKNIPKPNAVVSKKQ
jgi:hypothetical protein